MLFFAHQVILLIGFVLFFELALTLILYFIYRLHMLIMLLFHGLLHVLDLSLSFHCWKIEFFDPVPFLLFWCLHGFMKIYIRFMCLLVFLFFRCLYSRFDVLCVFLKTIIAIIIILLEFIKCGLPGPLPLFINGKELILAVMFLFF